MAMKLQTNRSGKIVKSINKYEYFVPTSLYRITIDIDSEMISLLSEASRQLGILDWISSQMKFSDTFVAKYIEKEALLSAQIEGTQASLYDVFEANKNPDNTRRGVEDVVNYIKSLNEAMTLLEKLPLSTRFFNQIHKILISCTRGKNKCPGEIRKSQNWIGGTSLSINDAWYVPPAVEDMIVCLSDLENYINDNVNIHPLIKIALIHYQFESIHPYVDGNGRLGRLLISLLLKTEGYLTNPVLYLSLYLKQHRGEYYGCLSNVRIYGEYERWVKFFLTGIIVASKQVIKTMKQINDLKDNWTKQIIKLNKNNEKLLLDFLDFILAMPYFNFSDLMNKLNIAKTTANSIIKTFVDLKIIDAKESNKDRFNTYKVTKYLDILEKGTEL
ncbi:MAG: Fic family protein [Malacoplasma sp.]|nr:Fic family protein [Malacoplasma sp.]